MAEETGGGAAEVAELAVPDIGAAGAAKIVDRHVEEHTGPKLDEAAIVVSGGRGLGEAGKYEMIEELAKLLKGAPGASRAIVDAGWVPYSYQVGQTGKVVKPTVYIAAGISGATQHMVGHEGLEEHHRHQQGPGGADLRHRRPRHRRRRPQGAAEAHRGAAGPLSRQLDRRNVDGAPALGSGHRRVREGARAGGRRWGRIDGQVRRRTGNGGAGVRWPVLSSRRERPDRQRRLDAGEPVELAARIRRTTTRGWGPWTDGALLLAARTGGKSRWRVADPTAIGLDR